MVAFMFKTGTILDNKYQIQEHLGTGGMGEVYRVLDLEQDREYALKILNEMMDGQAVRRRFHREFQMLSRLQHPRLVRTYTWGFAEDRPYFTMDYLPGKTLKKIIADQALLGQFLTPHFFDLIQQLAEGLAYVHTQGAVHRDLKPSNIMVLETEEGIETTILDLGLAKFRHLHSVSITQTGAAIGTAEYMSPEQGKGLWVDHRSDLYSLGIILYEMLTGTPPFSGQNPISVIMKHIRESPPPIGEADVEVPEQTQQIVLKLLAKEPVDRYQSAEEVVQALNSVASSRFVLPDDNQRDVPKKVMRPQFVGRESEMKTLRAMLKDVQADKQRVVLISGEAGVGKSRLVEELLGDARVYDFLSLKSAGREEGGQIYGALIDAFRQVKTTDLVGRVPDSLETDKFSVMERWLQVLKSLRQKQPIVLCLEDIQWLDELTLEFLQYVLRDPDPCPFLLCLTCRWSNMEPLTEEIENFIHSNELAGATQIQLKNLSQEASGYLAASMLGEQSIPRDALQTLFRETGGQPVFVVEAVRALVNADVVRQGVSGHWQWGVFSETLLSDDFSEVLYRRVATLPGVQRRVLEYACVFLSDFSFELLAAVWRGDELELLDVLDDLIAEGLLEACGEAEDRYRFSQDLCRRAIYDRVQDVRRRLLHREIGSALEKTEQAEELTEELADHFAAAEEQNKAVKYMCLAGKKALEVQAYRQARMRFEAVRDWATDDAFESQTDAIDFLCDYADVLRNCGQHNRALELLDEAKTLLPDDRRDLKARICKDLGDIHSTFQKKKIAEEHLLKALQLYCELDDPEGEIQVLGSLAYLYDVSGRHKEAVAYMRLEIEKYATPGEGKNKAIVQRRKGLVALVEFRFETAKEYLEATVKTSQKLGLEHSRIWALNFLQRVYFYLGEGDLAESVCHEVIGEWRKRGIVYWEAMNFLYLGELALERDDFSGALEYAETSAERFLETSRRDYIYRAYAIAATAAAILGNAETALEWVERASEGTQQTSGMYTGILPLVHCGIGAAFAQAGRIAEAEEAFEQAIECRRESKGDPWARALLMAGEFYLERGDVPKAQAHLEAAKQAFKKMEMSYFLEKTQVLLNQSGESSRGEDAMPIPSSEISVDMLSVDRLSLLYDVSRELTTERDVKVLLDRTLGNLLTVYPAERVVVANKNETQKGFVVDAARYHNLEADDAEALSGSIIRRVIETNEPVLSFDAQTDDRLNQYQSVIDYNIRSVLCVPLFHIKEGVMGALYVDHRGMGNAFSEADQTFLQAFANLVGMALVNAKMYEQLEEKAQYLQQQVERRYRLDDLVGQSDVMQAIYRLIETAAKSDIPVLVQGETGTGKELAARAIHYNSTRKDQRFFTQNCAALSPELLQSELFGHKKGAFTGATEDHKGIFETADGGTVLLDEIADASPQLQKSLLRVLQEGKIRRVGETEDRAVDVRIIAATNRDLKQEVENGSFREDLYYRLQGVQIDMPPLREHLEDVPLLAEHLLIRAKEDANKSVGGLTLGAIKVLTSYKWPGNVRELKNKIQLAVALAEEEGDITPDLFSESIGHTVSDASVEFQGYLQDRVQEYEKQLIRDTLEKYEGNITQAARELGMTRVGLHKKINRLGLI